MVYLKLDKKRAKVQRKSFFLLLILCSLTLLMRDYGIVKDYEEKENDH
jgi:hypothetical protein